jgi:acetoacetyl-CoA synthetase
MYSSGTTGVPKCIVHGAGGTLLQHAKELLLQTDLKRDDTIFYFTTCGWMMWNWLVSSLMTGATVVLFDGSPAYPDASVLWKMAQDQKVTVFGTSAKFISICEKAGVTPGKQFDLSPLRAVLSTGSPLSVEDFEWVYREVKADLQLASISGGTDIISCFMLGSPVSPVYSGEIQKRGLGMKVEAWNDDGKAVIGEKGELVCTAPFPSMPIYFWKDPDNEKYLDAYFRHFEGIWRHGDYIEVTEHGGVIVYGRSDATLNPSGVRIGTAEIYRQVEALEEVVDSLVIGQPWENDVRVVLFVVLRPGLTLDAAFVKRIKDQIRKNTTPRHVPEKVIQVADIPRTINGKKVELAVIKTIQGQDVKNKDALANPEALDHFKGIPELQS